MADITENYVLGRGEIYFGKYTDDDANGRGERYLGNTPEFSVTIEAENLDHFSSDRGVREKDDSVAIQVNRQGQLSCDNIDPANIALFFFGESDTFSQASEADTAETISNVEPGLYYQIGQSADDSFPTGKRDVTIVSIIAGSETFTAPADYTLESELGRIYIVPGGDIASGDDLVVTYDVAASTRDQVISGATPIEGALRFVAVNPKGDNVDYYMPWVKLTPNGDFSLKGEEWQTIPFSVEVLKKTGLEAIYADGRPL